MFDTFPLWPARASTTAGSVDALYIFLVGLSALVSVAIFTMIVVFAVRYRRRRGVAAEQIEGSTALEVTWSVIPLFIFVVIFVWGAVIYFNERTPPRGATEVYVVAKQWMWKLQHEEGQREINELHVPLEKKKKMILTSQDVIHSFYVPAFRIKQDVLPGRYTTASSIPPGGTICSAPNIADRSTGNDRTSRGARTGPVRSPAQRRRRFRNHGLERPEYFSATGLLHPPPVGYGRGPNPVGCSAQLEDGESSLPTRTTSENPF
jgi:hypothetical protein